MDRETSEIEAKEQQKLISNQATLMVNGGGGWLECKSKVSRQVIFAEQGLLNSF